MEFEELKYLDLALPIWSGNLVLDKEFKIKCYFQKENHVMHSNNSYMNTLVDMIISLGMNLEKFHEKIDKVNTHIQNYITTQNKLVRELISNIDYIKQQNNDLLLCLNKINNENKENNITVIFREIEKITGQYNKIKTLLKELKHLSLT